MAGQAGTMEEPGDSEDAIKEIGSSFGEKFGRFSPYLYLCTPFTEKKPLWASSR